MRNFKIEINEKNNTIEVGKSFMSKARKYGSEEYKVLQEVRKDYPGFKVTVISTKRSSDGFKGLTFEYMEAHIRKNRYIESSEGNRDLLVEFFEMCGKDESGKKIDFAPPRKYGEIKKWFLAAYPIFNEQRNKNLRRSA